MHFTNLALERIKNARTHKETYTHIYTHMYKPPMLKNYHTHPSVWTTKQSGFPYYL